MNLDCRCMGRDLRTPCTMPPEWEEPTPATQEDGLCDGCRERSCESIAYEGATRG